MAALAVMPRKGRDCVAIQRCQVPTASVFLLLSKVHLVLHVTHASNNASTLWCVSLLRGAPRAYAVALDAKMMPTAGGVCCNRWLCGGYVRTDEAVQRQRLGKNQDQDHADVQLGLLSIGPEKEHAVLVCTKNGHNNIRWYNTPHARVAHDANGHAGSQASESTSQP